MDILIAGEKRTIDYDDLKPLQEFKTIFLCKYLRTNYNCFNIVEAFVYKCYEIEYMGDDTYTQVPCYDAVVYCYHSENGYGDIQKLYTVVEL